VVEIIRKGELPQPEHVPDGLREAAMAALRMSLREPRPVGFPLLFTVDMQLIEPAVAFLHEHAIQRAHTGETVRTYAEILYDWFDALEQSGIPWNEVDTSDLIAYRSRMLKQLSQHTGRPYSVRTINHRVRGVLRFYRWAVRNTWLPSSPLAHRAADFPIARGAWRSRRYSDTVERCLFTLRQYESLPRPLSSAQARELLARLPTPYDLMARWQLYTGLRTSELLRLRLTDVLKNLSRGPQPEAAYRVIDVMRKGRKHGYVIAPASLLEETDIYLAQHRTAWQRRAARKRHIAPRSELFINNRGSRVPKSTYQQVIQRTAAASGFKATPHVLRATFACWMLAHLEQLATRGAAINPLLIVKILMSHEHIATTDRYLRAVSIDMPVLAEVLEKLLVGKDTP
jgi:integrase/recombinase XerD